eukprot:3427579-Rhodomonas_salina.1
MRPFHEAATEDLAPAPAAKNGSNVTTNGTVAGKNGCSVAIREQTSADCLLEGHGARDSSHLLLPPCIARARGGAGANGGGGERCCA